MNQLFKSANPLIMEESQFARLIETYGGEIKRWPPEYRAAAQRWLNDSETARRLQHAALTLDNLLDTVQLPPPSPMLRQRILASARRTATTTQDIWQRFLQWVIGTTPTEHLWRPAVTFLLPLILGVTIGFYSTQAVYTDTQTQVSSQASSVNAQLEQEISLLGLSIDSELE